MLGEKERFYILGQQIYMLQILGTSVKIVGNLCSGDTKKLNLGDWGGPKEGLSYYILQIQLFHSPSLLHFSTLQ